MTQQTLIPDEHLTRGLRDLAADYSPVEVVEAVRALWPKYLPANAAASHGARTTDRQTSHAAAAKHATRDVSLFKAGSTAHYVLAAFTGAPQTANGAASAACTAQAVLPGNVERIETARKRVNELAKAGYIDVIGVTVENENERTLYEITAAGRRAISNLTQHGWSRLRSCTCGEPTSDGRHRADGPCYIEGGAA